MVLTTLRAMALGGMRDHIGGGFHRYSVDGDWRVPHFEKMLYDQAQLVLAYLEAAQVVRRSVLSRRSPKTRCSTCARDLTDAGGGFYSAEDADSVPPEHAGEPRRAQEEGAFYIWPLDEVRAVLGDDSRAFELRYGLLPDGNAPFDPQNEFTGKNLLYTARGIADIAHELQARARGGGGGADARARARCSRRARTRPRPHLDDKVLTGWNGLMIAAFARAARVLGGGAALGQADGGRSGRRHLATAERAATFLRRRHVGRRRAQSCCAAIGAGDAAIDGYAEDYAYLIFGLLELFQAERRRRVARVGDRRCSGGRTSCSGMPIERRLVQHDRDRSVGAASA